MAVFLIMVGVVVMLLVNGTMYTNAWAQPISENDEIVIMPPIEGG